MGFVNDYSYVFSLRNFTRIILQGIGSQKIGSVAFRDSWAFIHHYKTNINYNFEEVIISYMCNDDEDTRRMTEQNSIFLLSR